MRAAETCPIVSTQVPPMTSFCRGGSANSLMTNESACSQLFTASDNTALATFFFRLHSSGTAPAPVPVRVRQETPRSCLIHPSVCSKIKATCHLPSSQCLFIRISEALVSTFVTVCQIHSRSRLMSDMSITSATSMSAGTWQLMLQRHLKVMLKHRGSRPALAWSISQSRDDLPNETKLMQDHMDFWSAGCRSSAPAHPTD